MDETEDRVAWYRQAIVPVDHVEPVAGLVAFYDEKFDVFLDGELQPRPRTSRTDAGKTSVRADADIRGVRRRRAEDPLPKEPDDDCRADSKPRRVPGSSAGR